MCIVFCLTYHYRHTFKARDLYLLILKHLWMHRTVVIDSEALCMFQNGQKVTVKHKKVLQNYSF